MNSAGFWLRNGKQANIGVMELTQRLAPRLLILAAAALSLPACMSEVLERQAEQIRQQEAEIARQRKELEALAAGKQVQDRQQQDCNRAFREYFEKAQLSNNRDEVLSLYRKGLEICPDDDVAHFEYGRALAAAGRRGEAEQAFEAALRINPSFSEARRELDALRNKR
jgi:tetratricopeptide (TPR) repeat protein